jgi:hypothetical protein
MQQFAPVSFGEERRVKGGPTVRWTAPGYIERLWNLAALSGLDIAAFPVEELLFAAAFGAYWAGVYDQFTWRMPAPTT